MTAVAYFDGTRIYLEPRPDLSETVENSGLIRTLPRTESDETPDKA